MNEQLPKNIESSQELSFSDLESEILDMLEDKKLSGKSAKRLSWESILNKENLSYGEIASLHTEIKSFIAAYENIREQLRFPDKNSEKFFDSDNDAEVGKETKKEILNIVEEAKGRAELIIGSGKTSDVVVCERDPHYCFKIITHPDEYAKGNDVQNEAEFLNKLKDLQVGPTRTPKPICSIKNSKAHVLVMEYLDAVTLKDVLDGKEALPSSFDFDVHFKSLEDFVCLMHEKKILHRDLHAENILICRKTGAMFVIDFGKSKHGFNNNPEEYLDKNNIGNGGIFYLNDDEKIKEHKHKLRSYLRTKQ
jgi:tRNA A-37 threonylcarbamoyl transferase component Bud32